MRRILALLLALAMLSGLCLTGCGKNEDPSVETTAATEPSATVPADEIGRASCRERVCLYV